MRFATAVIERYKRRETNMGEAIIEVHLAGVSTRRIEDVSKILWGAGVSTGMAGSIAEIFPGTRFEIRIPCDNDDFILLRCPHCDELFKLTAEDIKSDEALDLYRPSCGLSANNLLAQDVIDLALAKTGNYAMDAIVQQLQAFTKRNSGSLVRFGVKANRKREPEPPIRAAIEALQILTCHDCGREAKVSPAIAMSAYTCLIRIVFLDMHARGAIL